MEPANTVQVLTELCLSAFNWQFVAEEATNFDSHGGILREFACADLLQGHMRDFLAVAWNVRLTQWWTQTCVWQALERRHRIGTGSCCVYSVVVCLVMRRLMKFWDARPKFWEEASNPEM